VRRRHQPPGSWLRPASREHRTRTVGYAHAIVRPRTDDYPDHLERVVVALLAGRIEAARQLLAPIAEPRREVTVRKEASERVIASIYKRDRFRCRYCGCRVIATQVMRLISYFFPEGFPYHPSWKAGETHPAIAARSATLDHVVPWTAGGTNDPNNLVCACWICNQIKGDLLLGQLGWELLPISSDSKWDGLTRYYRQLWELADCPRTADHPFWVRLFD
jgi:hypothetical protein